MTTNRLLDAQTDHPRRAKRLGSNPPEARDNGTAVPPLVFDFDGAARMVALSREKMRKLARQALQTEAGTEEETAGPAPLTKAMSIWEAAERIADALEALGGDGSKRKDWLGQICALVRSANPAVARELEQTWGLDKRGALPRAKSNYINGHAVVTAKAVHALVLEMQLRVRAIQLADLAARNAPNGAEQETRQAVVDFLLQNLRGDLEKAGNYIWTQEKVPSLLGPFDENRRWADGQEWVAHKTE